MVPELQGAPCTVLLERILRRESCHGRSQRVTSLSSALGDKSPGKHKPFHLFLSVCVAFSRCKFSDSSAFDFQGLGEK